MLLFNHHQKRKFIFFKFQEESIKKLKDKQNNIHINSYYQSLFFTSIVHSKCFTTLKIFTGFSRAYDEENSSKDYLLAKKKIRFNIPAISVASWAAFCSNRSFICLILKFSVWASSNCCSKDCSSKKDHSNVLNAMSVTYAKFSVLIS